MDDKAELAKYGKRARKALILAGKKVGELSEAEKKTPSQKRSEMGKVKEQRRAMK
jgi:hypothetical protein